ncbi:SMI1/KNR4 family protein [Paenibacillus albidus]|uniref:SMI1/KNR4 family protein n=1 Tax=Paenibacillus albidus TaxID=2041023 RepID=UPI00288A16AA|nr:SMI1/KNR4 family protein [Paenibacillus albidus]
MFKISDEQREGILNLIGNDPGGNVICLGINKEYYETIYFWDHEEELNDLDMSNMYFLANSIYEFLDQLYENSKSLS